MEIVHYIVADDRQLIDMALEGDIHAFDQLFKRYRDSMYQLYYRMGGSRDDAEDLLQETFIKVYLNLNKYNPEYTFGQWIYTIGKNTFIDYMRKRRGDVPLDNVTGMSGSVHPASVLPNPEETFINSQQRLQIENHLAKMTPRYRQLIELRFFKDYSYEEIAEELSIPMGTVKTQIHRAREQLCRFITDNTDILP